jgi:hypothetical protein
MNNLKRLLPLGAFLMLGCGGPSLQEPADPGRAREVLQTVLDAWQRGETPDSVRAASPAIHVNDPDWQAGCRLTRYRITADGGRAGIDLRYPVTLTLRNPSGQTIQKNTTYLVGTSLLLTVVRHDPES